MHQIVRYVALLPTVNSSFLYLLPSVGSTIKMQWKMIEHGKCNLWPVTNKLDSRALKDMLRVQEARFSQHWLFKDLNVRSDIQSMQIVTISFCVNWLSSFHMQSIYVASIVSRISSFCITFFLNFCHFSVNSFMLFWYLCSKEFSIVNLNDYILPIFSLST